MDPRQSTVVSLGCGHETGDIGVREGVGQLEFVGGSCTEKALSLCKTGTDPPDREKNSY